MSKKSKKREAGALGDGNSGGARATIDPTLDALFKSSLTESTAKLNKQRRAPAPSAPEGSGDETSSSGEDTSRSNDSSNSETNQDTGETGNVSASRSRKRKRGDDDVEDRYLKRLAEEEQRDEAKRERPTSRGSESTEPKSSEANESGDEREDSASHGSGDELDEVPQHETLTAKDDALDQAKRTVFLSNVSTSAITSRESRKKLMDHLASILPSLPDHETPHKVESLRFRSTAFALVGIPKRAAFAKRELMEATTKSTNAYAVYTTSVAAREAVKRLNGSVILDRHIHVDSVAHPAPVDHHRCVFVGNLGFVDDESMMKSPDETPQDGRPKKTRPPGDVEEGLWRQFLKAGQVENVRVVRDPKTRVGKGFAYVQFTDGTAVERALTFNEKSFPPMLKRPLRVVRAKHPSKTASYTGKKMPTKQQQRGGIYNPKQSAEAQSLAGRANKLFGKGGAARLSNASKGWQGTVAKGPESFVFEGHRARPGQGSTVLKSTRKGAGKPTTRSSRRGAAFKAAGRKPKQRAA